MAASTRTRSTAAPAPAPTEAEERYFTLPELAALTVLVEFADDAARIKPKLREVVNRRLHELLG